MTEADYNEKIEAIFACLEEALDASELDVDYENQGSVFTIEMDAKAPLILNRHGPTQQLWLAAQSGGFHLAYESGDVDAGACTAASLSAWSCTKTGVSFTELWATVTAAQFGEAIAL